MKLDKPIREWKTKYLHQELDRVYHDFGIWQDYGYRPRYNIEKYAEDLAEELRNRGLDY